MRRTFGSFVLIFTASFAVAEPMPDFVKPETDYAPYRAQLEKAGWTAHGTAMREESSCQGEYDQRCIDFPEARECSGTGMGFCNMVWKHQDGTILVILTAGEEDPGVVSMSTE
jgi:hypothetical protein